MRKLIILIFAFIGWMLCGAIMWVGMAVTSVETTLIIHLIGAPVVFGILAFVYHRKFGHIKPLYAAIIFTGSIILMDAGLVALFIEKSLICSETQSEPGYLLLSCSFLPISLGKQ